MEVIFLSSGGSPDGKKNTEPFAVREVFHLGSPISGTGNLLQRLQIEVQDK